MADIARARALLGYEPRVPLSEGIPRAVAWATAFWAAESRGSGEKIAAQMSGEQPTS